MSDIVYSTFRDRVWRVFKREYSRGQRTEDNFWKYAVDCTNRLVDETETGEIIDTPSGDLAHSFVLELYATAVWRFKRLDHYFLDPGVSEFCVSSVKELTEAYNTRLPESGEAGTCPDNPFEVAGDGAFVVHFPMGEYEDSLMVLPGLTMAFGKKKSYFATAGPGGFVVTSRNILDSDISDECPSMRIVKLVYGLSLYMDAFPDAVVPSDKMPRSASAVRFKGTLRKVGAKDVVRAEMDGAGSPHWRKGHWRLLTSEKFVRKRGQTVWVKGTFVKGRAYDVLDDVA